MIIMIAMMEGKAHYGLQAILRFFLQKPILEYL